MPDVVGGTVVWNLDVDDKGFKSKINSASGEVRDLTDAMKQAERGSKIFAGALLSVGTAAISALGFGVKIAGDLEAARQGFVALLGSAEEADATMSRIKREAAATPFEITGLVKGTQALTAITKDGDAAIDTLLDVGKAIAVSGKGQAELDRVVLNLQQISATGKVTAMDIRQFQGAIPIFNDIIEASGLTVDELQNSANASELLFEAFRKAGQEGGIAAEGFTAQAGTFNQLWSNLIDTVTIGLSDFAKISGAFDAVKFGIDGLIQSIQRFTTPEAINRFMEILRNNGPLIAGIILGGLVPAIKAFGIAIKTNLIIPLLALLPYIIIGGLIGLGIQAIIKHLGGWESAQKKIGEAFVFLQGKLQPFVDLFENRFKRMKQILGELGISGEFGGLINWFTDTTAKVDFYSKRIVQIISEQWQKIKNFLAFGGTEGEASVIQALEGIWNRLQPLRAAISPLIDHMIAQFKLMMEVIRTQVKPAFDDLLAVLEPFARSLMPYVINIVSALAKAFGIILVAAIAFLTGIISGIANALPYVAQAVEGIIQFFRGLIQFLTGVFSGDFNMVMEGLKHMVKGAFDFFYNILASILKFVSGFIKGVIAFFKGLYDTLVGNSIIPDLVNDIFDWFKKLPEFIKSALSGLVDIIKKPFTDAWDAISPVLDKIKEGMNKINPLHRQSPSLVDNVIRGVNVIKQEYASLSKIKIPDLDFSFPQVIDPFIGTTPLASQSAGQGQTIDINVAEMNVTDKQDAEMIGREIGFRVGLDPRNFGG